MTMFMLSIVNNNIHVSLPMTGHAERAVAVLRGLPHGHHPPLPHRPCLPRSLSPHILWLLLHHPQQVATSHYGVHSSLLSACVATVKSRPVLHHCVVMFFWSSGIMECTCMLFTFENGVLLMR